jgi:kinesin family member C1
MLETSTAASRILELEEEVQRGEVSRRKLHNMVQELRGNVRVFARVRPFLPSDGVDLALRPEPTIAARQDGVGLKIAKKAVTSDDRAEEFQFTFDKVFGLSSSQEAVFQEVSEFVQSALDGYNVCLFSYGQVSNKYVSLLYAEARLGCKIRISLRKLNLN